MEDLKEVLQGLAEEIRALDQRIEALHMLLSQLEENAACFTDVEVDATRQRIAAELHCRETKIATLREKVEVYESRVLDLHAKLSARKRIMDDNPDSLQSLPELLAVFVDQHAAINSELDAARQFLLAQ